MRVIATAGHVDHGKSTLVRALTGINPDRLREEQQREMTIDLGFAWMTLPGGELTIEWRAEDDHVLMTGPATFEYEGRFDPALFSAPAA